VYSISFFAIHAPIVQDGIDPHLGTAIVRAPFNVRHLY